jgi:lysozyme family protein
MANHKLFLQHTKTFEGGHSADPRDNALKSGHSGVIGKTINPKTGKMYDARFPNNFIHTNAGVIWSTYVAYCKKKKIPVNASDFLQLSDKVFEDIFKILYWDNILGDAINSQGIAEHLMEAVWGGGSSFLIRDLYKYMNTNYNAKLPVQRVMTMPLVRSINTNINNRIKYKKIIDFLYNTRLDWMKTLDDWKTYGRGWTNRMNKTYDRALKYPVSSALNLAFIFKLFGAAAVFFF